VAARELEGGRQRKRNQSAAEDEPRVLIAV